MYNNHTRHPPPHQMYAPPTSYKPGNSTSIGSGPQFYTKPPSAIPSNQTIEFDEGPKITVFIGNISEKVPDNMIKKIIASCGPVANWKRVSTFGFCEYDGPKSGARAVRLLHDFEVDGKKLVAKVDAKNQELLNIAKDEENKKSDANNTRTSDVANEKKNDDLTTDQLNKILDEYKEELKAANSAEASNAHPRSKQITPSIEIEEGKRELINKEIGRFRKYAEEEEAKKEKDKKKREAEKAEKKDRPSSPAADSDRKTSSRRRSRSRSRSRERREREKERERERERERDRERREIERNKREMEMREKENRERERFREEPKIIKNPKEREKEKEMIEEEDERRRAQKRNRDKEIKFMERLESWEARERRKAKEYEKLRDKELRRQEKREKEARKMKVFLEDYDDERDDIKFYSGKVYRSRLAARGKEAEDDIEDKKQETKELEKLKAEIFSGIHENPTQEFERQRQALENKYKPKIVLDKNNEHEERDSRRGGNNHKDKSNADDSDSSGGRFSPGNLRRSESNEPMDVDELSRNSLILSNSTTPNSPTANQNSTNNAGGIGMGFSLNLNKRRKIDPKSAFNLDDENEDANGPAKKKLVPLDYDENLAKQKAKREGEAKQKSEADLARSQEEKRKLHKQIIDKIPIDKEDLFNHALDRQEIDGTIKKKVQSWINKKIIEYIGEPEPTLVDFICSKLIAGSSPQSILDDVKMILDEEADIFVLKMWRLLIFEIEAKKLGIK